MESFWIHIVMVLFCHIRVIMKTYYTTEAVVRAKKYLRTMRCSLAAERFDYSKPLWKLPNRVVCCRRANPLRFLLISIIIRLIRIDTQGRGGNIFQQQPKKQFCYSWSTACGWWRFLLINSFEFLPAFGTKTRRTSKKHLFSITPFRKSIGMQLNDAWTLLHVETN